MHEEIKARKRLDDILTPSGFESLLGMILLFNRDGPYFTYSGPVTASLLDWEDDGKISIFCLNTSAGLVTFRRTREDLIEMLNQCDAFIGKTPEDSFLLEK